MLLEREAPSKARTDYWAWYKQSCGELRQVKESMETKQYRALDEKHIKWEQRKATLYRQLERACTTVSGADLGMQPSPLNSTLVHVLSPMVRRILSQQLPYIPDTMSSAARSASTSLCATAPDFSPVITTCLSIDKITSSVYRFLLWPARIFGDNVSMLLSSST